MSSTQASRPSHVEVLSGDRLGTSNRLVLTVAEVAEILGVPRAFVYGLVAAGELPAIGVGGRRVVSRRALLQHLGVVAADSAVSGPVGDRPTWSTGSKSEVPTR
jgi:excisionase family DNA binding protein